MKEAVVYRRSNGWFLHAISKTNVGVGIETPPRIKLGSDAPPHDIGHAAIEVLQGSTQGLPHPSVAELERGFKPMMELAGVKTWDAFAKHASSVSIRTDPQSEWLIVEPWENAGTKRGFVQMPNLSVRIRTDAPLAEIGEAIQKAMQLCVPQFP
jgi:hypothetical protein